MSRTPEERRFEAMREVKRGNEEMEAVVVRLRQFRDQFRDERDQWISKALETAETPGERAAVKRELCSILGVTPQWLNKLLKGEAYRRSSD